MFLESLKVGHKLRAAKLLIVLPFHKMEAGQIFVGFVITVYINYGYLSYYCVISSAVALFLLNWFHFEIQINLRIWSAKNLRLKLPLIVFDFGVYIFFSQRLTKLGTDTRSIIRNTVRRQESYSHSYENWK